MNNLKWLEDKIPKADKRRIFFGELSVIFAFVCFTFITSYDAFLSFDLPFPVITLFALFLVLGIILLSFRTKFSFSLLLVLPVIRLILFFFSAIANSIDGEKIIEQVGITFLSIACFLFFNNYGDGEAVFRKTVTLFALITDIQIAVCLIRLGSGYDKNLVIAGIGESNYAASFLLIAIVYLLFRYRTKFEIAVLLFSLPILVLTLSFGAYLGLLPTLVIWYIGKMKQNPKKYRMILIFLILLLIIIGLNISNIDILSSLWQKIRWKFEFLEEGDFEKFSSSRVSQYGYSWASIKQHPFFGSIVNYNSTYEVSKADIPGSRTHNVVLESLLLYGIVGSLLNLAILSLIIKRGKKYAKIDTNRKIFFLILISVLIHGSLEPNFFTLHFELFIWAIFGLLCAPVSKVKDEEDMPVESAKRKPYEE